MIQTRTFGTLLALGALTALPACSYFGGHQSREAAPATSYAAPSQPATQAAAQQAEEEQQPVTAKMIRQVQAQLRHDHLYRGRVDGKWGPQSAQAAMRFQQQHNLSPTGKIDLPTLQAMNLAGNGQDYGQGDNGQNGNPSYGQNGSANGNTPGMQNSGNQNYTTGSQNPGGTANANNMPDQNNTGTNGSNDNGTTPDNGNMPTYNGGTNNNNGAPQH